MSAARTVFVVAAKRTPFGTFGGKFRNVSATDLAEHATRAAIQAASIGPEHIDHIVIGNVMQSSKDAAYLARHVGIKAGVPEHVAALVVNRLCGSGFESIICGSREILLGESEVVLAGGTENMTQGPFTVRDIRFGTQLGKTMEFEDTLWDGLTDQYIKTPMGVTAETLGAKFGITRQDADDLALRSQTRWRLANNAGHFKAEISPITVKSKKGDVVMDCDEHPRETTAEILAKLPPVFKKAGLVTAGNASGISDGAGALVLASEEAVKKHHLTPLAKVVGWKAVGVDPHIMGYGPVPAIRHVLSETKLKMEDMDLIEINEAFAPQAAACAKELKLDLDKFNVSGGAIALGHPLGASGSRISAHLIHELRRRQAKYGIGSACTGGGMGVAILFENIM